MCTICVARKKRPVCTSFYWYLASCQTAIGVELQYSQSRRSSTGSISNGHSNRSSYHAEGNSYRGLGSAHASRSNSRGAYASSNGSINVIKAEDSYETGLSSEKSSGQGQQGQRPHMIRLSTICSSDFGPTSLLSVLPTDSNPAGFSVETGTGSAASPSSASASMGPQMSGSATASGQRVLDGNRDVGSVSPGNLGAPGGVKSECANCGATRTPLWRRGLNDELNCNACGVYAKLHKRARPKNLRTSHGDRAGNAGVAKADDAKPSSQPIKCHNCATTATPLWRKDDEGNTLCNACGLFLKLHGIQRPLSMKSDVIRKRSRHGAEKQRNISNIVTTTTSNNSFQNSLRYSPTPPSSAGSGSSGLEPITEQMEGSNNAEPMGFPFPPEFRFSSDYMPDHGMGLGGDLTSYSYFGSYGLSNAHGSTASVIGGSGRNSAHSSPNLRTKSQGNSPPYFALDMTLNNANKGMGASSSSNSDNHVDQRGHMSPNRSPSGSNSSPRPAPTSSGVMYDFYRYPIHPPTIPLHPPDLIHPQSTMRGERESATTATERGTGEIPRSVLDDREDYTK